MGAIAPPAPMALLQTATKALKRRNRKWNKKNKQMIQTEQTQKAILNGAYTAGRFVWCDRPFYLVKQPQEKWACDFHDDALPLSFQLQVAEVIF